MMVGSIDELDMRKLPESQAIRERTDKAIKVGVIFFILVF